MSTNKVRPDHSGVAAMKRTLISGGYAPPITKDAVQKSLEETQILFDSLMQQYFG